MSQSATDHLKTSPIQSETSHSHPHNLHSLDSATIGQNENENGNGNGEDIEVLISKLKINSNRLEENETNNSNDNDENDAQFCTTSEPTNKENLIGLHRIDSLNSNNSNNNNNVNQSKNFNSNISETNYNHRYQKPSYQKSRSYSSSYTLNTYPMFQQQQQQQHYHHHNRNNSYHQSNIPQYPTYYPARMKPQSRPFQYQYPTEYNGMYHHHHHQQQQQQQQYYGMNENNNNIDDKDNDNNDQYNQMYYNGPSFESNYSSISLLPQFISQPIYPDSNINMYYNPNRMVYPTTMQWYGQQYQYLNNNNNNNNNNNGYRKRNFSNVSVNNSNNVGISRMISLQNEEAIIDDENEMKDYDQKIKIVVKNHEPLITLNILNLPSANSNVESITRILTEILNSEENDEGKNNDEDENKEKQDQHEIKPLTVFENIRIYKYSDQELCWCSFQLCMVSKLDILIKKLNGYNFHNSILKCFVQPPSSFNNDYNYNSPISMAEERQGEIIRERVGKRYINNSNSFRQYNHSNYYRYYNNYENNGRRSSMQNQYNHYKNQELQNNNKPLGNNYNSIVFPNLGDNSSNYSNKQQLEFVKNKNFYKKDGENEHRYSKSKEEEDNDDDDDDADEKEEVEKDNNDIEKESLFDKDIIDDNELTTEELKKFNEFRHVSKDRIFIGNIPFNSSYHSLWLYLTNGGENIIIKELQLKFDSNGISKGFAVCITKGFSSSIELIDKFNGQSFHNRRLTVRFDKQNELILQSHMKRRLGNW
ncbi:hypothetical protein C6P42_002466 [Pichia californica]|nr:hypothetical protein C6P42_002466 [[Candida] californica]